MAATTIVFTIFIMIVNIFGAIVNGAVIILFIKKPSLRRGTTNKFLMNFMITGFFITFNSMVMAILFHFRQNSKDWLDGLADLLVTSIAFELSLLLVTLDRFIAVQMPLRYKDILSTKRVYVLIAMVWMLCSAAGTSQAILVYKMKQSLNEFIQILTIVIITLTLVSMFVLTAVNLVVFREVKRQIDFLISVTVSSSNSSNEHRNDLRKQEEKSVQLCYAMVLSFIVCWSPLLIYGFLLLKYNENTHSPSDIFPALSAIFIGINTILNPCLYTLLKEEIWNSVKKMLPPIKLLSKNCSNRSETHK